MSVVEITSTDRYNNGVPVSGGLYDAALGFCDYGIKCKTCGNEYSGSKKVNDCPGHFGHIQVRAVNSRGWRGCLFALYFLHAANDRRRVSARLLAVVTVL